jgi:hypothetical protein
MVEPLICAFPLRLTGADGAPVRAVAIELARDGDLATGPGSGAGSGSGAEAPS